MTFHKLLEKQIRKYLPEGSAGNPALHDFLNSVNESYYSQDRDRELLTHAFSLTEEEYKQVNDSLLKEHELKKFSIEKLKESLQKITGTDLVIPDAENNDLLFIADYLTTEVNKRKYVEERYKNIVEKSSEIIYKINQHGFFTFVNPVAEYITGYSEEELCRMHYLDLVKSEYKDKTREFYKKQVKKQTPSTYFEFPILTKAGREIWIGQSVQLSLDHNGDAELVALAIDISKQKQSERDMIESNQKLQIFHSLMNNTTDAIQVATEDGKIFYMNQEASRRLAIAPEETGKYTVRDIELLFKEDGAWEKHVQELKEKRSITLEGEQVNVATGKNFPVEVAVKYIHINGTGYIIANSRDITVRKTTERLLKAQEEKYRNIIANMNLGLLEVDIHEKIKYANQSFQEMSGYSSDELIGKIASKLFAADESLKLIDEKNRERKKGVSDMYEVCVKNKSGETKWWIISGAPYYNDEGNLLGSIGIHLDITRQKRLENELEKAKQKAEEASKAKESFLANMSHEIRTPLNAINGMIRELDKEELSSKQKEYVKISSRASRHLLSIINNILDISKIEAGELGLENEDFIPGQSLSKVISMLRPKAEEKGIYLRSSLAAGISAALIGDALRIEQIMLNLVSNAIKFTSAGGIDVNWHLLSDDSNRQQIEIEVKDTGIGMSADYLHNIFSKFSQEDKSTSRKYGGTGLGMAITYELVQLMDGRIDVQSEKDAGTTFCVRLSLAKGDVKRSTKEHATQDVKTIAGARILLVEDNELNRLVAQNTLKYYGCRITEAVNGVDALKKLAKEEFDLVLMDVQMPEMDGIEATRQIRNRLRLKVPVIALTANAFKTEMELCRQAGMDDFVTKPFEEAALIKVMAKYLHTAGIKRPAKEVRPATTDDTKLYSLSFLEEMSFGDKAFISKMILLFVEQTEETIQQMNDAFANGNLVEISRLAHRIRPGLESMGILVLRDTMLRLENDCLGRPDRAVVEELLHQVTFTLKGVLAELRAIPSP